MRQSSRASGGIVTQSCWSKNASACSRQVAHQVGLAARLDVGVLDLLHRRFPVVAESHLPRRGLDLRQTERVLALGDRDQLLRRVGDHLVVEILLEPVRADRLAHDRPRVGTGPRLGADDALAQGARVARERRVQLLGGLLHPPGKDRIVAVVVAEPAGDHAAHVVDVIGGAVGDSPGDLRRGAACPASRIELLAQAVDLFRRGGEGAGGSAGIDCLETAACVLEREQSICKGKQRRCFGAQLVAPVEQRDLMFQVAIEQHVIHPSL